MTVGERSPLLRFLPIDPSCEPAADRRAVRRSGLMASRLDPEQGWRLTSADQTSPLLNSDALGWCLCCHGDPLTVPSWCHQPGLQLDREAVPQVKRGAFTVSSWICFLPFPASSLSCSNGDGSPWTNSSSSDNSSFSLDNSFRRRRRREGGLFSWSSRRRSPAGVSALQSVLYEAPRLEPRQAEEWEDVCTSITPRPDDPLVWIVQFSS